MSISNIDKTREEVEKLKKLADAMYYAANYLTTDASRLHKAMDEYHQFIIHEYKEEPEYLEEETKYCAFSTSRYTDKDRKVLCKGCEEECRFNQKGKSDLNWKDMSLQEKKNLVAELSKDIQKEEPVSEEPKFKQGDILYNVSDGNKIKIIDIVADQYKFECGDEYPHYEFFGYIESNYSKCSINEGLDDYAKEILSWEDSHENWDRLVIRKTAKYFIDWQKEKDDEEKVLTYKRGFEDCKEQMMKDAVDGKIYETQARSKLKAATIGKISGLKYRVGDKVKLIILKEE